MLYICTAFSLEDGHSYTCTNTFFIIHTDFQSLHSDIDECSSNSNGCQMLCINTIGSFNCSCESGYKLIDDGFHCQGIALYIHYTLLKMGRIQHTLGCIFLV